MSVQRIQEQCALIDTQIPIDISKEGCYFMGNTGVGKSTLINYLLGQKMSYKYDPTMENFTIFPASGSKNELPKIGNQEVSETMIPKSYQSENGLLLYDTPGFLTTMGSIQEILDSYANYKIFVKGSSIKIILVIDEPTLKLKYVNPKIFVKGSLKKKKQARLRQKPRQRLKNKWSHRMF